MFDIKFRDYPTKKAKKLVKKNPKLQSIIAKTLIKMKNNPFDLSLKTHKVNSKSFGFKYSSSITGDLRFIWDFDETTLEIKIIEIFDIGGHSGNSSVY
jgi:mRNA-degrading endonuclease YafQ of YafQ-DinJ toxin-antitoxin module